METMGQLKNSSTSSDKIADDIKKTAGITSSRLEINGKNIETYILQIEKEERYKRKYGF